MWFSLTILSAFFWAVINVGNSILVAKYHKNHFFLNWTQTFFSTVILLGIALTHDVSTPWVPILLPCAVIAYIGDVFFLWILDRLDISVVNAAWAILAIFMSLAGFLLFHEIWTPLQFVGASFVLIGVLIISFFHAHISFPRTLLLLGTLALLYVPSYVARKAALNAGEHIVPVVFWLIFGRDVFGFLWPTLHPTRRREFLRILPTCRPSYFLLAFLVVACFFLAEYSLAVAYSTGPVSLISVTGNVQPFFVIFLAGLTVRFVPSHAPKELFTLRSTGIKLASFLIVFFGLALLGAGL